MNRVLEGIIQNRRIAAAYLFLGSPASGKEEEASLFADSMGCRSVDKITIKPDGVSIKIDQVRQIQRMVRYGPSLGEYLMVLIERADTMTAEAAGAFLKTLEEPPPGVVFVLLVEREDQLPLTIVSRCQRIFFGDKAARWESNPEFGPFYLEMRKMHDKNILETLDFSSKLEAQKEKIENLLYELIFFSRYELKNLRFVRILLEAVKNLKKKSNLKLTLDVACLRLGEACQSI